MSYRDMAGSFSAAAAMLPAVYAADSTAITVDLAGYDGATFYLYAGAGGITFSGTNKIEFVVTHSDDDSTYANVATGDIVGGATITSGIVQSYIAAKAAASVEEFGYVGKKRYVKFLADFSGTHGVGTAMSAVVVRGYPVRGPVA